ncbi:MAG: glycoside hydrolase domain-containing protein [Candidatus Binataceae bacterium]
MGQRTALRNAGWGLAPLYVGQQIKGLGSHNVTGPQGTADGQDAAALLNAEGFVAGTCVYLDLEDGPPFASPRTDYVAAWVDAVQAGGFGAGVYCSHGFAADVHNLRPSVRMLHSKSVQRACIPFQAPTFPICIRQVRDIPAHPSGNWVRTAS